MAVVLGAASGLAQFMGPFIDNGVVLVVCAALVGGFVLVVMTHGRARRRMTWAGVLLLAVSAGGAAGYAAGRATTAGGPVRANPGCSFRLPTDAGTRQSWTTRVYEVDEAAAELLRQTREKSRVPPVAGRVEPPCDDCAVSAELRLPF